MALAALSRYLFPMALRSSREPGRPPASQSPPHLSMRLLPRIEPLERRRWALIVAAVIAIFGIGTASVGWLTGEGRKPIVETASPSTPHKPIAPTAPATPALSKVVVDLPPKPSGLKVPAAPVRPPSKLVVGLPMLSSPTAPGAPDRLPSKLVVGLPPITAPPEQAASPESTPQQPTYAVPQPNPLPRVTGRFRRVEPSSQSSNFVRF